LKKLSPDFRKTFNESNIKNSKFHTFRHKFGRNALARVMNPKTLNDIMGLYFVFLILDTYVHPDHN